MHKLELYSETPRPTNAVIAVALEQTAKLLEERGANPHRVQAYRTAAETIRATDEPLAEMVYAGGAEALEVLPGIGQSLSQRIAAFVHTGELKLMQQLRTEMGPVDVLARVTGLGRELAKRIHQELGVESLEALELAAHDGRLDAMPGFGERRVRSIRAQLDRMLTHSTRWDALRARADRNPDDAHPSVADLLNVDEEYRYRAERGDLRKIAPSRFNASGEAWLPVLDTRRGSWRFMAMFSNTPRAHELGKTNDWVVLYYDRAGRERQSTVVTETRGDLRGKRVVRGREQECRDYYFRSPFRLAA